MSRRDLVAFGAGLALAMCLHMQAFSQDGGAGFSSETKYGDMEVRVHRLVSDIAYTLDRANLASDSLSTNAQGHGRARVYHATAIRKVDQLRGLLEANPELGEKHASLLNALKRASELDRVRESEAARTKGIEQQDEYWEQRLREIKTEVLPPIMSNRVKTVRASQKSDGISGGAAESALPHLQTQGTNPPPQGGADR